MMDGKQQKYNDMMNVKQDPMPSLMNVEAMHTLLIMGTCINGNNWNLWLKLRSTNNVQHNIRQSFECIEEDGIEFKVDTKEVLESFSTFYNRATILFIIGKIPSTSWA